MNTSEIPDEVRDAFKSRAEAASNDLSGELEHLRKKSVSGVALDMSGMWGSVMSAFSNYTENTFHAYHELVDPILSAEMRGSALERFGKAFIETDLKPRFRRSQHLMGTDVGRGWRLLKTDIRNHIDRTCEGIDPEKLLSSALAKPKPAETPSIRGRSTVGPDLDHGQSAKTDNPDIASIPEKTDIGIRIQAAGSFAFWKARQPEFEKYGAQYPELVANWVSDSCTWWLQYGETLEGILRPAPECVGIFKALARNAVWGLPSRTDYMRPDSGPRAPEDAEPWQIWLDFMRLRGWNFHQTGTSTPCTEFEWDAGVKDGKPLMTIRLEQTYSTDDEWKKVYRRTGTGKLRRLSAKELTGKTSDDLRHYYHWLPNGTIAPLFQTSARFCEELASQSLIQEATLAAGESLKTPSAALPVVSPDSFSNADSVKEPMLYRDRVHFQYDYPSDFPEDAQLRIESLRVKTTGKLQDKPINSFADWSEAKRAWVLEMVSGAAPIIGSVAVTQTWGANQARKMLKDFALQAAYAVGITAPAAERFFRSDEWKCLDDALFLLPDTDTTRAKAERRGKKATQVEEKDPDGTAISVSRDLKLLHDPDGKLKELVTMRTAAKFGGVGLRAIQKALSKKTLRATGRGQNRRVDVDSLLHYFPAEK
jgi:hypothetical protein